MHIYIHTYIHTYRLLSIRQLECIYICLWSAVHNYHDCCDVCVYVHEQEKEYMVNQVHIEQLREEIKEHTQECEVVLTAIFIIT